MTASIVNELQWIPMSPNLAATIERAGNYASAQSHVEVTLEHLLLALTEDEDAAVILVANNIDTSNLKGEVSIHLGRLEHRFQPGEVSSPRVSPDLSRILSAATEAAKGRRSEINGAIVLAAIVGDAKSTAAHLLESQGLTFEDAIRVLQTAQSTRSSDSTSTTGATESKPATSTDDILAKARDRVATRTPSIGKPPPSKAREQENSPSDKIAEGTDKRTEPTGSPRFENEPTTSTNDSNRVNSIYFEQDKSETTKPPPTTKTPRTPPPTPIPQPPPAPSTAKKTTPPPQQQSEPRPAPQRVGASPTKQPPQNNPRGSTTQDPQLRSLPPHARRPNPAHTPPPPPPQTATQAKPVPPSKPPPSSSKPSNQQPPRAQNLGGRPAPAPTSTGGLQQTAGQNTRINAPHARTPHQQQRTPTLQPNLPPQRAEPTLSTTTTAANQQQQRTPTHTKTRSRKQNIEAGQMVENIPRTMRVEIPQTIEIRIAKTNVPGVSTGMRGGSTTFRHELLVTNAMSVRLRAPDGGFFIETASPETQWIESNLGMDSDAYASWRWTVTPKERGKKRLQVIVSARTVGIDGLAAETAMPDRIFDIRIRTNYSKSFKRIAGWTAAAIVGGLLARFGEQIWVYGSKLIQLVSSN